MIWVEIRAGRIPSRRQIKASTPRAEMGMGPDGAGDFPDRDQVTRPLEAFEGPPEFLVHQGQLQPERRRLGMNPVGPPHHRYQLVFLCLARDHPPQFPDILDQNARRLLHLDGQGGVDDIR